ncbi:MAG: alpha-amylase/4-alpha-glucanotransferase domain-containing protein, partial [Verrucomicrobiota bacterium]
ADQGDLVHQSARVISVSQNSKHIECVLEMNGKVDSGGTPLQVRVRKAYLWDLQGTQLKVSYQVTNESGLPLDGIFSSELNIMAGSSEGGGIGCINEKREFNLTEDQFSEHCRQLQIKSPELGFEIALLPKKEITLWSYPLETENASPGITYQGACINLGWDLDVAPGESADFELGLRIGRTVLKKIG